MAKCSFCGKVFMKSTGSLFAKKDGTAFLFCSGKCQKNMLKLHRSPFAVKWTEFYHKEKEKDLKQPEKAQGTESKKPDKGRERKKQKRGKKKKKKRR